MNLAAFDTLTFRKDAWVVMEKFSWLSDHYTINSYIWWKNSRLMFFFVSVHLRQSSEKCLWEKCSTCSREQRIAWVCFFFFRDGIFVMLDSLSLWYAQKIRLCHCTELLSLIKCTDASFWTIIESLVEKSKRQIQHSQPRLLSMQLFPSHVLWLGLPKNYFRSWRKEKQVKRGS